MGKGGSNAPSSTNTVVQNSAPPPEVMAQYQNVINQANSVASTPYTTGGFNASNMIAPFSNAQLNAFNTIDQSQGIQNPYLAQAGSYIQAGTTPLWNNVQQYNPTTMAQYANPYLQQAVGATEAQMNNMNAQQQQQVVGNAISSGAWGGDRSAVAQSELANQQTLANNQTIANMENTGFNQQQGEFNTQQQAQLGANEANAYLQEQAGALGTNLGTTAQSTALEGANAQLQSGATQQQQAQEMLNVPYEQFQAQQSYPFQTTGWLSDISTGVGGSMGGTSSTTTPGPSTLSQVGGLGLTGLAGLGAYGSSSGLFSGLGLKRGGAAKPHGFVRPQHFDIGGALNIPQFGPPLQSITGQGVPIVSDVNIQAPSASSTRAMGVPTGSTSRTTNASSQSGPQASPAGISGAMQAGKYLGGLSGNNPSMYGGFADALSNPITSAGGLTGASAPAIDLGSGVADTGALAGAGAGADTFAAAAPAAGAVDLGAAAADTSAVAGGAGFLSSIGDALASVGPFIMALFNRGGSVGLKRASGGLVRGYDNGGGVMGFGQGIPGFSSLPGMDAASDFSRGDWKGGLENGGRDILHMLPMLLAMRRGGSVPQHFDDGGSVGNPWIYQTNPMMANRMQNYTQMNPQQLRQMSQNMQLPGTPQAGQNNALIQRALKQKEFMPNVGQAPQNGAPMAGGAPGLGQPQGFARGGFNHYDDGGGGGALDVDDNTPVNIMPPVPASNDNAPSGQPQGFTPQAANNNDIPDHDAFMANYNKEVTNQPPMNAPNPWMALAMAGAGMMAGQSPHALENVGKGLETGLTTYGNEQKEAAEESARKGDLQAKGESLYQQAIDEKNRMNQETAQLAETSKYHTGELANQAGELAEKKRNDLWERQKPIPDGFGGFLIPNPNDPTKPTTVYPGSNGSNPSQPSMANLYNPPKDKNGNSLTGDAFLATIPPPIATQAKMYIDGMAPPPTGFASKPQLLAANQAAAHADPTYTGTRYSTIQDFTKGGPGSPAATVQSQTAVMEHLGVLQKAVDALNNGDTRAFNSIAQTIAKQNGEAAPTNMEMATTIVGDEMAKAIVGARVTQGDRQEFGKNLTTSAGRDQLNGQIGTASQLMAGQQHALENRWAVGTGWDDSAGGNSFREKFINPKENPNGRALYEKYYPTPMVKVKHPDGTLGSIPATKLKAATAAGYQQVQ